MNLFVQTPSHGTITLDTEPSDSIENIKGKIFDAISIPTQNQLLKFNGEHLSDNRTLADYNITNNSTIILTDATLNNIHQAILSAGGNATGNNGSASYSIGQVFYQTSTSANNSVAAGVQQAGCSAPTITASTPNNRCGAGSVTLSATPSAGSIQWFTAETGGTALVSGTDYTISGNNLTINNLTATTTFYAQAVDGACVSAARTAVMATVNNVPAIPTFITTPATCTANGTAKINAYDATLTYTSSPTGATVGAAGVITGIAGTAYTFTAANANCTSAASEAVTIPVQLSGPICTDNFITTWTSIASNTLKFNATTNGDVSYTYTTNLGKSGSGTFSSASYGQVTLTLTQNTAVGEILTLVIAPTNLLRLGLAPVPIGRSSYTLTNVNQWGITPWSSMADMFLNCRSLNITATDLPVLTNVADMSNMFNGCSALNGPANINNWNTATVTNMSGMFRSATVFNQNIGNWNTTTVTNMSSMFRTTTAFNQNIGNWNTTAVTDMNNMFNGATAFNQNIENWNTAAVTDMSGMFRTTTAFNQNIGNWNTAAVTNMSFMFSSTTAFNQNIGNWNTAAVTNMSFMFSSTTAFNQNIENWNTTAVTDMSSMFSDAAAFNQNIGTWNTAAVTNMSRMFNNATSFNQNIGAWNTAAVTDMNRMFFGTTAFNQNIGDWNTANVTDMNNMFSRAAAFNQNIGDWNTAAVKNMNGMFSITAAFNQNIGAWNTAAVTDMTSMFNDAAAFNQDIGDWNTAAVTKMDFMFASATAFNQNLGYWTLNPSVTMVAMLQTNGMDCANYSATLQGWAANTNTPNGRSLGAAGRFYGTNAETARNTLTTTKGWTITSDRAGTTPCILPAPTLAAISNQTTCNGQTISNITLTLGADLRATLTASDNSETINPTYTFGGKKANRTLTIATVAGQVGSTTVTITATGPGGTVTQMFTLNVSTTPTITASTPASRCGAGAVTLSATPSAGSIQWFTAETGGTALVSGTDYTISENNLTITNLAATTTFYAQAVDGACVSAARTAVIATVNDFPASPTPSSDSPKCVGSSLTFNSVAEMTTYAWAGPNAFTANTQNPTITNVTAAANGTYTLTVTNSNGCSASATTAVTINALPVPNPSSDSPKCVGNTLTFNAASGMNAYAWAGPNTFTASTQNPIIENVTAAANGTYTLTVTNASGCTASATTAVMINALPIPTPSSDSPKCVGTTLTFNAASGMNAYAWSGPNSFTANTQNPIIENVTAAAQGTYTLTVTNANSCSASATTAVTINALPVPTSGSNSPVCSGNTLNLTANGGSTYLWQGPNSFSSTTQNPTISSVTSTNTSIYSVTVTNAAGCTATTTTSVTVFVLPNAIISSNSPVCAGTTINLTAENGGTNYSWTGPNEFNSSLQNPTIPNSVVANSGIYKLTTTHSSGCTATATITVLVNQLSVNATNTGPYLTNQTVQLVASGGDTYSWTGPNGFTATGAIVNRSNATLNMAGIYTATITNGLCSNTATTNVIITGIDPCVQLLEYTYYKAGNPGVAMFSIQNGMNIAQENFPTSIIVRPTCSTLSIESVEMNLQGPAGFNWNILQNIEPFALFDNFGLNTFGRTLAPGTYTLAVTGYSQDNKGGTVTYPTVNTTFTIVGTSVIINMPTYTGTAFCAGNTVNVNFTTSGVFNANNQFNIQLSDASGDFTNAISIGTSTTAGNINCTIPQSMPYGENYRMRVLSSNTVVQNMNPSAITIHPYIANLITPTDDYSTDKNRKAVYQLNATNKISSPAKVNYQAGNSISLNAGFEAKAGAVFMAEIKACQN